MYCNSSSYLLKKKRCPKLVSLFRRRFCSIFNCMSITKCPNAIEKENCQVLVKNLNFLAGMRRDFIAIEKAEQIQLSFSTDKKHGKYTPLFPDQYLPKMVVYRVCFWFYNEHIFGFLNRKIIPAEQRD